MTPVYGLSSSFEWRRAVTWTGNVEDTCSEYPHFQTILEARIRNAEHALLVMSSQQHHTKRSARFHQPSASKSSHNSPHAAISNGFFNNSSQMIVSGGNFNYIQPSDRVTDAGFLRLEKAAVAAAMHTSGEEFQRPGCYENTRVAVLKRLKDWGVGDEDAEEKMMWLYGDAGAGKSAIAQTLAVECARVQGLLASFFFFRNDTDRANYSHLVATMAYQAVMVIPALKEYVTAIIEQDPKIFEKDLELQFGSLLIDPMNTLVRQPGFSLSSFPRFIIIDGLDECETPDKQCRLLKVLAQVLRKCDIPLKVLIASRPEIEIKAAFNSAPFTSLASRLALDNSFKPDDDILHFLRDTFQTIKETHPFKIHIPASWPSKRDLKALVHKSSGQFIYASIVAKYVSSPRHKPVQQLEVILGLRPIESEKDYPFGELDALYTFLFSAIPTAKLKIARRILGFVIVVRPLRLRTVESPPEMDDAKNICEFLLLEPGDEEYYLADLASVLHFYQSQKREVTQTQIQITHASLSDFLLDPKRSKDFFISRSAFVTDILHICFRHLKDLTLDQAKLRYYFICLPKLLSIADFTPGLRNDLALFSLPLSPEFLTDRTNRLYVAGGIAHDYEGIHVSLHIAMGLVHVLRDLVSFDISILVIFPSLTVWHARKHDSGSLLSQHQHGFDNLLRTFLEKCCCDRILLLPTLIDIQWPSSFDRLVLDTYGKSPTFLGAGGCCLARRIDLIFLSRCCIKTKDYRDPTWMLHGFFKDSCRSGRFALNGARYATAVIECLNRAGHTPDLVAHVPRQASPSYEIATSKAALFAVPHLLERAALSQELASLINSSGFKQKYHWVTLPEYKTEHDVQVNPQELVANIVQAGRDYLERSRNASSQPQNSDDNDIEAPNHNPVVHLDVEGNPQKLVAKIVQASQDDLECCHNSSSQPQNSGDDDIEASVDNSVVHVGVTGGRKFRQSVRNFVRSLLK